MVEHWQSLFVLVLGLLVTGGTTAYIRALSNQRVRVAKTAQELTQLIDTANAPIFGIDVEGKVNEWNQTAERITGFTKDDVMGHDLVAEFINDDYKASVKKVFDKALRGEETSNYEFPLQTKAGERVDVLLNSTTRRDVAGNIVGVIGIGQDITERNRINAEREQLVQAVAQLNECVVLFDQDDRIVFCNEAYRKLNEAIIEYTEPGTLFEDHLKAGVRAGVMPDAMGREDEWVAERMVQHRNPKGPVEVSRQNSTTVLINEQKLPNGGIILLISDITEIKISQAQVIQASKLAILGEMATSVAHELNQPLNVIRMAAGNVLRKLEKGKADPTYLNDKLERIASQTERAAAIIDHMRMFGRKADEKPHELDPSVAVEGALHLMGEQLRLAEIEVVTDLSKTCRLVLGHKLLMEQVILNLLTNARDAIQGTPADGGGKITLAVDDGGADTVRIIVSDSGGGIPKNALDRIFEPFFTTKEMGKGTGLGLSVSYGIIRDMGGTIEVENAGGGAKFTITLPVARTDAEKGRSDAI